MDITQLYELIAPLLPDPGLEIPPEPRMVVGIETERGAWVVSLVAAGYQVYALNPLSAAQYRERDSTSGRSRIPQTRTCWRRSSAWTGLTTARSPATPPWPSA